MFMQNIIKLSIAVYELSCAQALFLPYLAMAKKMIKPCSRLSTIRG